METPPEDVHDLLPWYLNDTLGREEAAAFEGHLPACAACREEIGLLGAMRSEIKRHGEEMFSSHPDPQRIVAESLGELDPSQADEVRRHLSLCLTCAAESRTV